MFGYGGYGRGNLLATFLIFSALATIFRKVHFIIGLVITAASGFLYYLYKTDVITKAQGSIIAGFGFGALLIYIMIYWLIQKSDLDK